jgi:hypothetical protein
MFEPRKLLLRLAAAALLTLPVAAQAHRAWMLPSATVLSGDDPWVTVDAAVSNDLFVFEHFPLQLDNLVVLAPDGTQAETTNPNRGRYRSTFDLQLKQPGTYRLTVGGGSNLMASWMQDGQRRRWRGSAADFATAVPANAPELRVVQGQRRVETFVTRGAPSTGTFKPTGEGLELVPVTHPNDLVAGEAATFRLLLDGQPAKDIEVAVVPGGKRYRDTEEEVTVKTDAEGAFSITWPKAGMYWIEAEIRDNKASVPNATRSAGYAATLEVLP